MKTSVGFDSASSVTTLRAEVELPVALSELAPVCDPRGWASLASGFFVETCEVELSNVNRFRRKPTVALGLPWQGVLFEHVVFKVAGLHLGSFKNLLNIDFRVAKDLVQVTYSLHEALLGRVGWYTETGSIDVDQGYLRAEVDDAGVVRLTALKEVRFSPLLSSPADLRNRAYNRLAQRASVAWFERMVASTSRALLRRVAVAADADADTDAVPVTPRSPSMDWVEP